MRKTFIFALLFLALLLVGAPIAFGLLVERHYDSSLAQLSVPGLFTVRKAEFRRGLFTSESQLTLQAVGSLCNEDGCPVITANSMLFHGPLPFEAYSKLGTELRLVRGIVYTEVDLSPLMADSEFSPPLSSLISTTVIGLSGDAQNKLKMPAGQHVVTFGDDPGSLTYEDITGHIETRSVPGDLASEHAVVTQAEASINIPSLVMQREGHDSINLSDLSFTIDGQPGAVFVGKMQGMLGRINVDQSAGDKPSIQMQGLRFTSNVQEREKLLSNDFELQFKQVQVDEVEYGPVLVDGALSRMNRPALEDLQDDLTALRAQADLPQELVQVLVIGLYQKHLPRLLSVGPELNLRRMTLSTPDGDMDAQVKLSIAASDDMPDSIPELLRLSKGYLKASIPAVLLEKLTRQQLEQQAEKKAEELGTLPMLITDEQVVAAIEQLKQDGWIKPMEEEQSYVLEMKLANSDLLINGQPSEDWAFFMRTLSGQPE